MDTSGSMYDEFSALCTTIDQVVARLKARGLTVDYRVLGIARTYGCAKDTVYRVVPGGTVNHEEDWGPAVTDLARGYTWQPGYTRLIVPMGDEGPQNGDDDGVNASDEAAIDAACASARANGVIVSPIQGTPDYNPGNAQAIREMMEDLASCSGGLYFSSKDPANQMADALASLIGTASCTPVIERVTPNCDVVASTTVTLEGRNFLAGASVELQAASGGAWTPAVRVVLSSPARITFGIPTGLATGAYQVRVVNPGGHVGAPESIQVGQGTCGSGGASLHLPFVVSD
jgi:hypothetical protein